MIIPRFSGFLSGFARLAWGGSWRGILSKGVWGGGSSSHPRFGIIGRSTFVPKIDTRQPDQDCRRSQSERIGEEERHDWTVECHRRHFVG